MSRSESPTQTAGSYLLIGVSLSVLLATVAWGDGSSDLPAPPRPSPAMDLDTLRAMAPGAPNPYLSFLPASPGDERVDVFATLYWDAVMSRLARDRNLRMPPPEGIPTITEGEPNDTVATANLLADFGTDPGEIDALDITASFAPPAPPTALGPFPEDDGAIPLASETGLVAGGSVTITGTIGDGPHGSSGTGTGDHDFFRIPGVLTGQSIVVDVETTEPFDDLDTFIAFYDSAGNILALNEDGDSSVSLDSFLALPGTADSDVYLSIAGSLFPFAAILLDPFDPTTGFGVGSEGDYTVTIRLENGDQDWFAVDLEPCDILGISWVGADNLLPGAQVLIEGPGGELVQASSQDLSGAYPAASPLPGGGQAVLAHVVDLPGRYHLRALGAEGDYTLVLRIFRQPREAVADAKRIFVDFDGATLDPAIFGATAGSATLSPLTDFLAGWGLAPTDEDAVIDATLAALEENLIADPDFAGPNPGFAIELLNSRDDPDPFGDPDVSRLIVGGSIGELGIPTIGIAQSIDPGDFEAAETAVVLLDLLSGAPPDPNSLNTFDLDPSVTRLDLVGLALGNILAHEAGHYVGNFHTEQFDPLANLMDRGGNLPNTLGLGPDEVFGSADDVDVDFGDNLFEPAERFAGIEDTLAVVACGCSTSAGIFADGFETGDLDRWSSTGR